MDSDINVPVDEGDNYVKFRAGRMFMEGTKVVPDPRKGLIRLNLGEDRLFRFQWLDRTRNVIEHNEIMFPDEATFEKVDQSSGRVYILKYKTDERKYFFWMQEPNSEGDRQLMLTVNLYINTAMDGSKNSGIPYPPIEDIDEDDILSRDGNLVGPALGGEASSDVTSTSGPVKLEDLQRILSNIGPEVAAEDPDEGLGLGDILKPDLILPLIETLSVEESFGSYLPEGHWSAEEFIDLLQSPPFRQQVDSFTYVLRTGQIDLTQFGIDPSKYKFTVMSFLEALEDSVSIASASSNSNEPMDESQ